MHALIQRVQIGGLKQRKAVIRPLLISDPTVVSLVPDFQDQLIQLIVRGRNGFVTHTDIGGVVVVMDVVKRRQFPGIDPDGQRALAITCDRYTLEGRARGDARHDQLRDFSDSRLQIIQPDDPVRLIFHTEIKRPADAICKGAHALQPALGILHFQALLKITVARFGYRNVFDSFHLSSCLMAGKDRPMP